MYDNQLKFILSLVSWGWGINWGSLIDWGSFVDWSSFVDWGCLIDWSSFVDWGRVVSCLSRIAHISNISTVSISNIVVNSLDTSIRESHAVASLGWVSIARFIGIVVDSTVSIIDPVLVAVDGGFVVVRLGIWGNSVPRADDSSMGSGDTGESKDSLKIGKN